jgi:hypothetical protein
MASSGYPLHAYSLNSGTLRGSTGPLEGAVSLTGVVLSPDGMNAYTIRQGFNGGLHRNRANFLFVPAEVVTTQVTAANRFGPLLSPDGNTIYLINTLLVLIEAYSLTENKILWRATLCPGIPPLLSTDGTALYSFDCAGSLVRMATSTSVVEWQFQLPDSFVPSSMILTHDDTRLLVAGQVYGTRKGYAYAVYTNDATLAPTMAPTTTPMPVTSVPSSSPVTPGATKSPGATKGDVASTNRTTPTASPVSTTSGASLRFGPSYLFVLFVWLFY